MLLSLKGSRGFQIFIRRHTRLRHALHWGLIAAPALCSLTGCASVQRPACLPNEQAVTIETLYFGTAKPEGIVTAAEWRTFVKDVVTPAFPDGLTSWESTGQWRMATGIIEQETSNILQLAHDGRQNDEAAIEHLMHTYKQQFQQDAVMRLRSHGCRSF